MDENEIDEEEFAYELTEREMVTDQLAKGGLALVAGVAVNWAINRLYDNVMRKRRTASRIDKLISQIPEDDET